MAFRDLSILFNKKIKKNNVKIRFSLNFWLLLATKHDYFISFNTCNVLVWTKYRCMVETFAMFIALINNNSNLTSIKTLYQSPVVSRIYLH